MARVTVEDCVDKIPNRYELLMVAAQRAKDLAAGAPLTVARDNDKNSVVALREIADETVSIEELQKSLVMGLQKYVDHEQAAEKELADLDDQFSGVLLDTEMSDSMQVHSDDDDVLDLDAADDGDADLPLDEEDGLEDGFDLGDDLGDGLEDEE